MKITLRMFTSAILLQILPLIMVSLEMKTVSLNKKKVYIFANEIGMSLLLQ